jgi:hypothetical protein
MAEAVPRGRIDYDSGPTPLKTTLFLIVCAAWLLPGLVGHDPWKIDEAVVFGIVAEILRTGQWIVFGIAGEPHAGKAPLFIWTSPRPWAACCPCTMPHGSPPASTWPSRWWPCPPPARC